MTAHEDLKYPELKWLRWLRVLKDRTSCILESQSETLPIPADSNFSAEAYQSSDDSGFQGSSDLNGPFVEY